MNDPFLIHFVDLDEMIPELFAHNDADSPVRVCTLTSREDSGDGFRVSTTYIAVRQIQYRTRYLPTSILSWAWPVGEVTFIPKGEFPEQPTIDDIAEMARTMETAVIKHLESAGNDPERMLPALDVRKGVIDIGGKEPLFGVWRKWEEENYQEIE